MSQSIDEAFQLPAKQQQMRQGRLLLHHFHAMLRTGLYHAANNKAMFEPSEAFKESLDWLIQHEGGSGSIIVSRGTVYAGSMRLHAGARQTDMIREVEKLLEHRRVGGLNFLRHLTADEIRRTISTLINFTPPPNQDGVAGLTAAFEHEGLSGAVLPAVAMSLDSEERFEDITLHSEVARAVRDFIKTHTVMATVMNSGSAVARSSLQRMVRKVSDVKGDVADIVLGLSLISATEEMSMRSMIVLLVALKLADQFGAPRDVIADLGDVVAELAIYDKEVILKARNYGYPLAGMSALVGLIQTQDWRVANIRHQLTLADRYLPVAPLPHDGHLPLTGRMGEVVRIACDYVDLVTPTWMPNTEVVLYGAPLAPQEALYRMRDYVGERYTEEMYMGLVRGVGLLPLGTAIETADGRTSIVVERTADLLTFVSRDTDTQREREAGFIRGPNQIMRVVVGADLLQERSKVLMGDDYETFQAMRQRVGLAVEAGA